jgi:hypothetical protein
MTLELSRKLSPWAALESIPGQAAVTALWGARLGEHYDEFKVAFLQRTGHLAHYYPCPLDCGCWHEVVHHGLDDLTGVCRCDLCRCDPLRLRTDDVRLWELRWARLAQSLCRALDLDFKFADLNLYNTRQIGAWSSAVVPALLTIQHEAGAFRNVVEALVARLRQPFILLTPTGQHLDAACQELLAGVGAGFFGLDNHVRFAASGGLQPLGTPGELFAAFTPGPPDALEEDAARKAFALVKALDAEQPARKASLYTVFRLYCVEGRTVEQVARQCRCARSLVFLRLGALRRKLGRDPRQLRQYSGHFEHIEESLADPRARRIYRKAATFGDEESGEGA